MSGTTLTTHRLLIVDDEEDVRLVLRRAFKDFQVEEAADARQALMSISRSAPDLVITDIHLTGMDGCALLANIRESNPDLPVIGISGYVDDEDVQDFGFNAFLVKPLSLADLRAHVLAALGAASDQSD